MKYIYIVSILISIIFIACKDKNPVNVEEQDEINGINIPQTSGFWKQTNGPSAGIIRSLSTYKDNYVLTGTRHNGLYISSDSGSSWQQFGKQFIDDWISSIAISSKGTIYIGVFDNGLYKYNNNSIEWESVSPIDKIYSIEINNLDYIFVGLWGSVAFSADNGATWQANPTVDFSTNLGINSKGHVFAGPIRSTDNGTSWENIPIEWFESIAFNSNDDIFVTDFSSSLKRSIDNGNSWEEIGGSLSANFVYSVHETIDGYILAQTSNGLHISYDSGNSWQLIDQNFGGTIFINSENGLIYAGTDFDGIYSSDDGGLTWNQKGVLPCSKVISLTNGSNNRIFAHNYSIGKLFKSDNKGLKWEKIDIGYSYSIDCIFSKNNDNIFVGVVDAIYKSEDNGENWNRIDAGGGRKHSFCEMLNGDLLVGTSNGLLRSSDNGNSWNPIPNYSEHTTSVASTINGDIYAGSWNGLYKSTDDGITWNIISNEDIRTISVNDSGYVFIGIEYKGIYQSKDEGNYWQLILKSQYPNKIFIAPNNYIYVLSTEGINKSIDNGNSWQVLDSGLTNEQIYDMTYDSDGYLYVGSWGQGVFKSKDQILNQN